MPEPAPLTEEWLGRYERSLLGVFGRPQLVLDHGDGAWVWDVDGRRYLDLVGGIAVNALGHNHPALVTAVSTQAGQLVHVSNFYTSVPQVELAERVLHLAGAPEGSCSCSSAVTFSPILGRCQGWVPGLGDCSGCCGKGGKRGAFSELSIARRYSLGVRPPSEPCSR